jgi:hypothetical protein
MHQCSRMAEVPSSLSFGELALNYADGRLYYKHANNSIASISTGSPTQSFATINANSSLILATSPTDTLSIIPGNNITITTDTFGKSIIINSTAAGVGDSIDDYARTKANSANVLAQAAFDRANTGTGTYTITGGQYIDHGWIPQTPGPILFDYGTL